MAAVPFHVPFPLDVVRVEGPDALTYLQSQLSQDLRSLEVGGAVASLVLEPAGRVDALVRVRRTAGEVYEVDVDAGYADGLLARLTRFMIRVKVEITATAATFVALRGPGAADLAPGGVPAWWADGTAVDLPQGTLPTVGVVAGTAVDLPQGTLPPDGVAAGTAEDLHAARVRAGWPAMGAEILPGATLPAESGVLELAVSFTKGCYPGQELVERMDSRGASAPRSLRRLTVAQGSNPGDPIVHDGAAVGVLTSVAGTDALGYVKRGVDLGAPLH